MALKGKCSSQSGHLSICFRSCLCDISDMCVAVAVVVVVVIISVVIIIVESAATE